MQVNDLLAQYATGMNGSLVLVIFVLMTTLKSALPQKVSTSPWFQRALPVIPEVLGLAGAMAGITDAVGWRNRLVVGLVAGFIASKFFKIGRTTVLGRGVAEVAAEDPAAPTP
jgi:hypothetical protein